MNEWDSKYAMSVCPTKCISTEPEMSLQLGLKSEDVSQVQIEF